LNFRYWKYIRDMTNAEFADLLLAVLMRQGVDQLYVLFPIDSVVKPRGDHTTHEWHVTQFDLSEDYQKAHAIVFDPRANVTAKFDIEDLLPEGTLRDSYWKVVPTTSEN